MPQKTTRKFGLARALSKLGYCSRTRAAELIRAGRVSLNGQICRNPQAPVHDSTQIAIDGRAAQAHEKIYVMMNKPRGVITTASDEKGRDTVYAILNKYSAPNSTPANHSQPWVAPVGRLDKASEGLLLLTNDSEWGAQIAAPETHLEKTYHVQIGTIADEDFLQRLLRGVKTKEAKTKGAQTKAATVLRAKQARRLRSGEKNCWLEIVLDEGKNRHIRRMMESLGVDVLRLVRVAIGPLQLGDLAKGQCRALTPDEKRMLDRALRSRKL